jgi:hypothetical protein
LRELKKEQRSRKDAEKYSDKYKTVKFFERTKAERKLKKINKSLEVSKEEGP